MTRTMDWASSEAAAFVAKAKQSAQKHLTASGIFSKDAAFESLHDVWRECRRAGWNGDKAEPVEQNTYHNAWTFLEALPLGLPLPAAGVEADGHLTLEWYRDPKWTVSVSVSPEGTLHYAGLFDGEDPRGSAPFLGEVPPTLLHLIRRVGQ